MQGRAQMSRLMGRRMGRPRKPRRQQLEFIDLASFIRKMSRERLENQGEICTVKRGIVFVGSKECARRLFHACMGQWFDLKTSRETVAKKEETGMNVSAATNPFDLSFCLQAEDMLET